MQRFFHNEGSDEGTNVPKNVGILISVLEGPDEGHNVFRQRRA